MAEAITEAFEGFPFGEVTFTKGEVEFTGFVLKAAGVIAAGTESTPEIIKAQHNLVINIETDYPDPVDPSKTLTLMLTMPVSESEYLAFRNPDVTMPEPDVAQEPTEPEPVTNESVLSMFAPKVAVPEEDDKVPPRDTYWVKGNLGHLYKADFLLELAETFDNRVSLETYLNSYGVKLPAGETRPITANSIGADIKFIGSGKKEYPLMRGFGTSYGNGVHGGVHVSPFTGERIETGRPPTVEELAQDELAGLPVEQWKIAVREDLDRVKQILVRSAEVMKSQVTDIYEHARTYPVEQYQPRFELERRKDYYKGYQQFAKAGIFLLHVSEVIPSSLGEYSGTKVRIDICEKKTDEHRPNHVVFWSDDETLESTATVRRLAHASSSGNPYYASSFGGLYGEMSDHSGKGEFPGYSVDAMRRSGLSDDDMDNILAGKKWGEIDNPFSHTDFFRIVEYVGRISGLADSK